MKSLTQLQKYTLPIQSLGYDPKNIHIVWVINDIEIAKKQNLERDRTVPVEILVNTHRGASSTMNDIVKMGNDLRRYMDGEIVFAFNKVGVDSRIEKSKSGGMYITDANYFYVKRRGKPVDETKLTKEVRSKISEYTPPSVSWED